jgi:hypothetical protein
VPVKVVSERLGHGTPAFTIDTYQHVLPGMQADATRVFEQLVAPMLPPAPTSREKTRLKCRENTPDIGVFFLGPVAAADARSLGAALLRQAMSTRAELDLASYDRFFPSQHYLPKAGFGNLIALPLQGQSATRGNTLFPDPPTLEPCRTSGHSSRRWPACHEMRWRSSQQPRAPWMPGQRSASPSWPVAAGQPRRR